MNSDSMSSFETVIYEREGPLARIVLNRPRVLNAYNVQMRDDVYEALTAVSFDPGREGAGDLGGGGQGVLCGGGPHGVRDCAFTEDSAAGAVGGGTCGGC